MRRISRKTIDAINTNVRISDVFEWLGETVSANRRMAFCPFCADKESRNPGCSISDDCVVWYTTAERSRLFRPDNRDYMFERLRGCDGIVCYNDQIAYGAIDLLTSRGVRVPEDVLVTGFDNSSVSEYSPVKITSFAHPKDEMGRIAANKLIHMLRSGEQEHPLILDMPLFEKQSTAR